MSRIVICGLNGSGKTTLGKNLAKRINYVHKDIEYYYFNNNNDYKYTKPRSRDEVINDLEKDTRLKRGIDRSYKQFGDRVLENGDLYE